MKKISIVSALIVLIIWPAVGFCQSFETNGRLSNSIYTFDDGEAHTLLYQTLRFDVRPKDNPDYQLHFFGRMKNDLNSDFELADENKFNAFRLSLAARNLFNVMDLEIGRQFLHPGAVLGSIDGVNATFSLGKHMDWQIYGGVETHYFHSFKVYENDEAAVYGGTFSFKKLSVLTDRFEIVRLQPFYLNKQGEDDTEWELTGFNLDTRICLLQIMPEMAQLKIQYHHDLVNERLHKFNGYFRVNPMSKLFASFNYRVQYPRVYQSSYLQFVDVEKYTSMAVNLGYLVTDALTFDVDYRMLKLEDGDGNQLTGSLSCNNGSVGLIYESGDLGEQFGVLANYGLNLMDNLSAAVAVDYSKYRVEESYNVDSEQVSNAVRLSYRISQMIKIDLEYQLMNNWLGNGPDDTKDHRFLNHIHIMW